MIKIKRLFILLIAAALMFICAGAGVAVYADTEDNVPSTEIEDELSDDESNEEPADDADEEPTESEDAESIDSVATSFVDYLKEKYGEDYNFYYDQIIEKWGSVEGYLLAFGNKLPEEQKSDWDKFVGWLDKYAPVWAPPLAVLLLAIVFIIGRKQFNKIFEKIVEKIVNGKLSPLIRELNLQSNATVSMLRAQKALLGTVPKFDENVKELEAAEKEFEDG